MNTVLCKTYILTIISSLSTFPNLHINYNRYDDNYNTALSAGVFVSSEPITQINHSFSVTIESMDSEATDKPICIGVVPETFSMSKKVSSYMYWVLGKS